VTSTWTIERQYEYRYEEHSDECMDDANPISIHEQSECYTCKQYECNEYVRSEEHSDEWSNNEYRYEEHSDEYMDDTILISTKPTKAKASQVQTNPTKATKWCKK
jgi:hypothetical protein